MERIDIENARILVEFRKNETNEVIKSEWSLYERDLMCDYFEIDGHIFRQ